MFIAHLPAGFLLTRAIQKKNRHTKFLWLGLLASVLPDFDLLYFYFADQRQTLHHEYWTHLPFFWLCTWVVFFFSSRMVKNRTLFFASTIFFANVFLHLVLDTFAAGIPWLSPFRETIFVLITVPARYPFWIENFILHWTFLIELAITVWAGVVLVKEPEPFRLS